MEKTERTMKSEKIYEGRIVSLKVETVELPDRMYSKREIVEHDPASAIVALMENDDVILIKQYRKAVDKILYEIPAGILEKNESPKECAVRELREETGFIAKDIEYIIEFYPSPGFCTEKIYVFLARGLEKSEKDLDEDEFIDCEIVPFDKVLKMIELGEIVDGKTISAILTYNEIRRKK
ncbi:NUDIX hydrolase [Anaerosphaera multitolerans]|uniref:NUDIX hydrolase n=1 Tax=Anaerosphaera multitolerans TaxID=2487351 RepID=A0A437S7H6_9FIRM|nr:NUDIX hydrolase [Anaerosphaera multitolerans]RVU54952.1 NUDIX hydrolase [Anaerosphaera multitolerans]